MARKPERKTVTLLLRVTVPADMSVALTIAEVKELINEQRNYAADPGDVRVRTCRAMAV